jgi:predicted RNA-binding protein with PUA-like domain
MNYWLMKSEPNEYSIDDLATEAKGYEHWDGVRNYQARNFMRQMRLGDKVFFYHSNTKVPGIVGIAEVVREAYPDHTQFDPENSHYDPKSKPENPRWDMVDVKFVRKLDRVIPLTELKSRPELMDMPLVRKGNRLSVMPVTPEQWDFILSLEKQEPSA